MEEPPSPPKAETPTASRKLKKIRHAFLDLDSGLDDEAIPESLVEGAAFHLAPWKAPIGPDGKRRRELGKLLVSGDHHDLVAEKLAVSAKKFREQIKDFTEGQDYKRVAEARRYLEAVEYAASNVIPFRAVQRGKKPLEQGKIYLVGHTSEGGSEVFPTPAREQGGNPLKSRPKGVELPETGRKLARVAVSQKWNALDIRMQTCGSAVPVFARGAKAAKTETGRARPIEREAPMSRVHQGAIDFLADLGPEQRSVTILETYGYMGDVLNEPKAALADRRGKQNDGADARVHSYVAIARMDSQNELPPDPEALNSALGRGSTAQKQEIQRKATTLLGRLKQWNAAFFDGSLPGQPDTRPHDGLGEPMASMAPQRQAMAMSRFINAQPHDVGDGFDWAVFASARRRRLRWTP